MPTDPRFNAPTLEQLEQLGEQIRRARRDLEMTQRTFAALCEAVTRQRFPKAATLTWTRERIARLERATKTKGGARALRRYELDVLAAATNRSPERLLGLQNGSNPLPADSTAGADEPETSQQELVKHLQRASELLTWAAGLPYGLQTREFMAAYNAAAYHGPALEAWNEIGEERRQAVRENPAGRRWTLTCCIFYSDLAAIAHAPPGSRYEQIPIDVRRAALGELITLLDKHFKIEIAVADDRRDAGAQQVATDLRASTSVHVVDDAFVEHRDQRGLSHKTTRLSRVSYWRGLLREFQDVAKYRSPRHVRNLLSGLAQEVS